MQLAEGDKIRQLISNYIELMEKLRKKRQSRDELLARAESCEGLEKARNLDKALGFVERSFWGIGYADLVAKILQLDPDDNSGLRSKYLPVAVDQRRGDIKEAMKKQDWNGTIVKID